MEHKNQLAWQKIADEPSTDEIFRGFINWLFIPDHIDIEIFEANYSAYYLSKTGDSFQMRTQLDHLRPENERMNFKPSPTFLEHYLDNKFKINKPKAYHDWFVIGYPDVTKWAATIFFASAEGENLIEEVGENNIVDSDGKFTMISYRMIIEKFLVIKKLECAL